MRTTINLPPELIQEALKASHCKTKTSLFVMALQNIILQNKLVELKDYKGKLKLASIDLDDLRKRK